MIMGMLFMIETPRWLVLKGRDEQATRNLCWLRQLPKDHSYIQQEVADYKHQLEHEMHITQGSGLISIAKEAFAPEIRFRLFLGGAIQILQNTTGINAINYFSPSIFSDIGISGTVSTPVTEVWLWYLINSLVYRPSCHWCIWLSQDCFCFILFFMPC